MRALLRALLLARACVTACAERGDEGERGTAAVDWSLLPDNRALLPDNRALLPCR